MKDIFVPKVEPIIAKVQRALAKVLFGEKLTPEDEAYLAIFEDEEAPR